MVTVRRAEPEDLEVLLSLYGQLAEDRPDSHPAPRPAASAVFGAIAAQPGRRLLVAEADGVVVGTADLLIVANLTHQGMPWAIVENVVVDERSRRLGVGRALTDAVIDRCREAGYYKVQLLSRRHRLGAHAFYESLGFEASAAGYRRYLG